MPAQAKTPEIVTENPMYRLSMLVLAALCACGGGGGDGGGDGRTGMATGMVGSPCTNPGRPILNGVVFQSGSADCAGNVCLITAPSESGWADHKQSELAMCTAACTTDADCASARFPSSQCPKLVCAVPSIVPGKENFCCQKLCMCEDDLTPGMNKDGTGAPLPRDDHGVAVPSACMQPNACMF